MTLAEMRDGIRDMLGSPSTSEISDTTIELQIANAISEYSQYRPLVRIGSFSTVANQQEYDLGASYAYWVGLKSLHYVATAAQASDYGSFFGDALESVNGMDGLNKVSHESLRFIEDTQLTVLRNTGLYDYTEIDDGVVLLVPVPTVVQSVYFIYHLEKTFADLKRREWVDVQKWGYVKSARISANVQNKVLQVNQPGEMFIMFRGGKALLDEAFRVEQELKNKYGINSICTHG